MKSSAGKIELTGFDDLFQTGGETVLNVPLSELFPFKDHPFQVRDRETMTVLVRELDDDEATIIMVDSNLQREKILR